MAEEFINFQMAMLTKDFSKMEDDKVVEITPGKMEINTQGIGKQIKWREMET
jgi:hypothetical protein